MAVFWPDPPVQQLPPPSVGAPTLARLLARVAGATPAPPAGTAVGRLGAWIDWPRAVELSRALAAPAAEVPDAAPADVEALAAEYRDIRAGLAAEIESGPGPAAASAGFAPFQRHIQAMQRAMLSAAGRLRGDLRECLAAAGPGPARLAGIDAQMEAALSPREVTLLAGTAEAFAARFEALQAGDPEPGDAAPAWLPALRHELRDLLLAELDLRFQPVEGLLAALRSP